MEKEKAKDQLLQRLQDVKSPLFTDQGNQTKNITPENVNELLNVLKSGPGVNGLLDELEKENQKFETFPELLAAVQEKEKEDEKELQKYLQDSNNPIWDHKKTRWSCRYEFTSDS